MFATAPAATTGVLDSVLERLIAHESFQAPDIDEIEYLGSSTDAGFRIRMAVQPVQPQRRPRQRRRRAPYYERDPLYRHPLRQELERETMRRLRDDIQYVRYTEPPVLSDSDEEEDFSP